MVDFFFFFLTICEGSSASLDLRGRRSPRSLLTVRLSYPCQQFTPHRSTNSQFIVLLGSSVVFDDNVLFRVVCQADNTCDDVKYMYVIVCTRCTHVSDHDLISPAFFSDHRPIVQSKQSHTGSRVRAKMMEE